MAVVAQKALRPLFFIGGEWGTAKTILSLPSLLVR